MQITVIEPTWNHNSHLPANLGCLRILKHLYPLAQLTFVSGVEQQERMQQLAPAFVASIECVPYAPASDPDTMPGHIWEGWQKMAKLPARLTKDADLIVQSSCTASSLWSACLTGVAPKTLAYLHGNANEIGGWRSRNPLRRCLDFKAATKAFTARGGRLVVLEERLRSSLTIAHPWLAEHIFTIGHPLLDEEAQPPRTGKVLNVPVKVGFAGLATHAKGFPEFLRLASQLETKQPGHFEFHAFGHLHDSCKTLDQAVLKTKSNIGLPRTEFINGLLKMDFIFAWHGSDYYTHAASGIVYDAINLGIPLIARNSAQIDEFHSQGMNIALAVDTIEEAENTLINRKILQDSYPGLLNGLSKARSRLDTPELAQAMHKIINKN